MSNQVEWAKKELQDAGLFDHDSDYAGGLGECALELMEKFSQQGHSGGSAHSVVVLFSKLAMWEPITPMRNPTETGEYIIHDEDGSNSWQSTRKSSVFSSDGGKTWYDIYARIPWWKRAFGVRTIALKF